jgi:adenylate cyclase
MSARNDQESMAEEVWRTYLTTGDYDAERRQRRFFRFLPGSPRCKSCYAPFSGAGSAVVRLFYSKKPSNMNPHLCNVCEEFARKYPGGAEVELSLLFADVRGSTQLAEMLGTTQFSRLINRFYRIASHILVESDALIDKIIGDQVAGIYVPGFAGTKHARRAIEAGRTLLAATGHGDANNPWIPLGVGIHTGTAYVGSVGSKDGTMDITVLGDVANTAARLASEAKTGEILISDSAYQASELKPGFLDMRQLALKGKSQAVSVHVLDEHSQSLPMFAEGS